MTLAAGDTWDLAGSVDFADTILLFQISNFPDAAGSQLAGGFALSAESGTTYATVSVASPGTFLLLSSGLLATVAVTRRRTAV